MQISDSGLESIKRWERFRSAPYNDGYGNMTIGYGHLIQPGEKFGTLTQAEALEILRRDIAWAESVVNQLVRVPLTQSQFDALVSLVFNWGSANFRNSSHLAILNSGDYAGTAKRIREHPITSRGERSQGLINRRNAEADLFLRDGIFQIEGETVATVPTAPPPGATPSAPAEEGGIGTGTLIGLAAVGALLLWSLSSD